jgi:hypothetical protein
LISHTVSPRPHDHDHFLHFCQFLSLTAVSTTSNIATHQTPQSLAPGTVPHPRGPTSSQSHVLISHPPQIPVHHITNLPSPRSITPDPSSIHMHKTQPDFDSCQCYATRVHTGCIYGSIVQVAAVIHMFVMPERRVRRGGSDLGSIDSIVCDGEERRSLWYQSLQERANQGLHDVL